MDKKAGDMDALKDQLLDKGMPEVEELAEKCLDACLEWVSESAMTDNKDWNDFIPPMMPLVKNAAKPLLDKIDGEEG